MGYSDALEAQLTIRDFHLKDENKDFIRECSGYISRQGEDAAEWCRLAILNATWYGDTFYWERDPLTLLRSAENTLPGVVLTREMLPSEYGFFFFSESLPLPLHYWRHSLSEGDEDEREDYQELPLGAVWWAVPDGNKQVVVGALMRVPKTGNLMPWGEMATFQFGHKVLGRRDEISVLGRAALIGQPDQPASEINSSERGFKSFRYWAAGLLFIQQRILTPSTQRPDRATRRRLPAEIMHEPLIRVIEFRKKDSRRDQGDEPQQGDWSCRWMVRGHWRQQWHPSAKRHQPKWITPYLKGPDDKPFKEPRATVYAVVR